MELEEKDFSNLAAENKADALGVYELTNSRKVMHLHEVRPRWVILSYNCSSTGVQW